MYSTIITFIFLCIIFYYLDEKEEEKEMESHPIFNEYNLVYNYLFW